LNKETPIQISYNNLLIVIVNINGQIKFITQPMANLLGYSVDDLIGGDINKLFSDTDIVKIKNLVTSLNHSDNLDFHNIDSLMISKNDESIDLDLQVIQLKNNYLNNYSYVILSDNIIYRKFVREVFKKSKHDLQKIYSISNELVFVLNSKRDLIFANNNWEKNFGIKSTKNSIISLDTFFDSDVIKELSNSLDELSINTNYSKVSLKIKSKLNNKNYYLKGYVLSEQVKGMPFIYQCVFTDITEDIQSEKVKNLYYNISSQIIENTNLQTVYKNIHEELKEVIDCDNLYIALYNPEENKGEIYFPYFIDIENKSGLVRQASKGLTEYSIKFGKPLSLTYKELNELNTLEEINLHGRLPEHWIGVPLNIEEKIIGVIATQSYVKGFKYSKGDLNLLDFASSQIAMAISMAQTREKLQNQTAQLNAIFDSSSHLIWSVNKELDVISFNKNYFDANFINHDIVSNKNNYQNGGFIKEESLETYWEEKYARAFKGEKLQFEINLKDDQNNIIWKEIHLNPIYSHSNKIESVSGIAQDITPKKHSELALLKSEEKFRNIFESFQDLYFRCNLYGSILMVSPSIYDLLGYQSFEVIGKHIDDYYLYNPRAKKILKELKNEKNLKNVEISIVKKNGEVRQCICNVRMVKNNENEPYEVEGVIRDITQLKITNQQLINANEISENSLRVKEQFLANMSHEIRTPMNGIIGMIDLLSESKLEPSQEGYVSTLKKSSSILMDILNNILDLAKIEAGRTELKRSTFSLSEIVNKIHALFTPVALAKNVNLHYHINKSLPQYINTDETKLIQILSNLISNSLKFTKKGGSIDIGFELIDSNKQYSYVRVDVRDSGIGISEENQKLLFNSFEQLDNSTTKSYGGTGLGLAISKQLAILLDGQIGVYSNPGLGSTFWFTFKAINAKKSEQILQDKMNSSPSSLHKKTVLVVDDNQINREVAGEILKNAGCNVVLAFSGEEAIEFVQNQQFDVILMDIQMPSMDGIETTRLIKDLNLKKPPRIVAMTAYAMKEDKDRFLNLGMDDYISKPIRAVTLIEKVLSQTSKPSIEYNGDSDTKSLDVINLNVVAQLKKYGGKDIIDTVFNDFIVETQLQLTDCETAIKSKDWTMVKSILHTLKGTSGTLGIDKMALNAKELEQQLKQGNNFDVEVIFSKLIDNFSEFKDTFKALNRN